jgi:hypothetical protein
LEYGNSTLAVGSMSSVLDIWESGLQLVNKYASILLIPNNASFTLSGLGEKDFSSLTGKPTNASYTLASLSEKLYESLDGKPTNASYTLASLSEKLYNNLDGKPTSASWTLLGLFEKDFSSLTGQPTNASYTIASLSEKLFESLDGKPTNASYTLSGLSSKDFSELTGQPTNSSYTLLGLFEKDFSSLTGQPTNASYTLASLSDVPSIIGNANKFLAVNPTATGYEYRGVDVVVTSSNTAYLREVQLISVATTTLTPSTFLIGASATTLIYLNGLLQNTGDYSIVGNNAIFPGIIATGTQVELIKTDADARTRYDIKTKTATYTVSVDDDILLTNTETVSFTMYLPTAVGNGGKEYSIKNIGSSTNYLILDPDGLETIDGNSTLEINTKNVSITIVSDNTSWYIK